MSGFDIPKLLLALLVVLMFCLVGVGFAQGSALLIILFTILGFGTMGYGISLKKNNN
ncbi:MAG TPA: DUF5325 family protein [Pseudogracilibacillus sp.]|nr:DUF5325 family protein [Pseudogracilibacillus sp.]